MSIDTSPNRKDKIISEYLPHIKGVVFTARQLDVISCLLHNRNYNKIAELLMIKSSRTVETHVRDIKNKIKNNSTEFIIDFIDKSGKRKYLVEYYFQILMQSAFEAKLKKIKSLVARKKIFYSINCISNDDNNKLLGYLRKHLELANIFDAKDYKQESINVKIIILEKDGLTLEEQSEEQNQENNKGQNEQQNINTNSKIYDNSNNHNVNTNIVNDIDDNDNINNAKTIYIKNCKNIDNDLLAANADNCKKDIDFTNNEDYYHTTLKLITTILENEKASELANEFKNEYKALQKSWEGADIKHDSVVDNVLANIIKRPKLALASFIAIIVLLYGAFSHFYYKTNITEINQQFEEFVQILSADNISTEEQRQKNYDAIDKVKLLLSQLENKQVEDYFNSSELTLSQLQNSLYIIHALANHYTYNEHNGVKALELLEKAKSIAQNYVINKNNIQINFDILDKEELYQELKIVKGLPELYTRIVYLMGLIKTSYSNDNNRDLKYLELAEYLGTKSGLFEGYLSKRTALLMRRKIIEDIIVAGDHKNKAIAKLKQAISESRALRDDHRQYIMNYKPENINNSNNANIKAIKNAKNTKTIIPAKDSFSMAFNAEQMVNFYSILISIDKNITRKQNYLKEVITLYRGNKSWIGLVELSNKVMSKRKASIFNSLGNVLLVMYDNKLNIDSFKSLLSKKLDLKKKSHLKKYTKENKQNDLDFILSIFELARKYGRNTEYVKADAYDGMVEVYSRMVENKNPHRKQAQKIQQLQQIQQNIKDYSTKRDVINKQLKRNKGNWRFKKN